ncbi:MAG: squalene/phytoene synthase family protein [Planctomycetota bacterium]
MSTRYSDDVGLPKAAFRTPRENFPVLSLALDRSLRPGFAAVYTFCRASDDIADDPTRTRQQRLDALRRWRDELDSTLDGRPKVPSMERLAEAIDRYDLPGRPFHRLLDAFEEDQVRIRYQTWSELEHYAERSANPVGELVLRLGGHGDSASNWSELITLSDATCTALQFVNFWQDVRRDLFELDRIYIPLADVDISEQELRRMAEEGATPRNERKYTAIIEPLVTRTGALMRGSMSLPDRADARLKKPIRLFQSAGLLVGQRIRASGYRTLWNRPRVGRLSLLAMSLRTMLSPARGSS